MSIQALYARAPAVILWAWLLLILAFLLLPLVVVIPESFSPSATLEFPPKGLSLRWYQDFFNGPFWLNSLWLSILLGLSSAALATALGLATAVALTRYVRIGKTFIRTLVLAPLVVPVIVSAIALFDVMARLNLVANFVGLLLSHTILALPFPVIILESSLKSVDPNLEDAARSLGASPLQAFTRITLPTIMPSVFAAALFAFMFSWDEVVVVLLVGGAFLQTLPVKMFEFLTTEIRPTVASASTLLIVGLAVVFLAARLGSFIFRRQAHE